MQKTWVQSLSWEDPLEKGKATHSSTLAWRIPWTVQLDYTVGKELDTTERPSLSLSKLSYIQHPKHSDERKNRLEFIKI